MRDRSRIMLHMNKLNTSERVAIIQALVEGCSINSTCRLTGRSIHTVLRLLEDIGGACQRFHDDRVCHLLSKRIQCDETWNFCYCKQKNIPADMQGQPGIGDCWTWVGIDADTKLIVGYLVGKRNAGDAKDFMNDIAWRLCRKVQLTTDGLRVYLDAVDNAFGGDVDYAQLIKIYGPDKSAPGRYSPSEVIGIEQEEICGSPEPRHVSTSFVERQNLTMRMSMRRFTRLTNGFSKKIENMKYAVALNFMYYNYCRIHQTLRETPAMAAGLTDHVWEIEELVAIII